MEVAPRHLEPDAALESFPTHPTHRRFETEPRPKGAVAARCRAYQLITAIEYTLIGGTENVMAEVPLLNSRTCG